MAVFATRAKRVTDEMLITAAEAVAEQLTQKDFADGLIYPTCASSKVHPRAFR
jgi:malate dehydrogenase (oxaloacetate-decarboxylating)(NADP+)